MRPTACGMRANPLASSPIGLWRRRRKRPTTPPTTRCRIACAPTTAVAKGIDKGKRKREGGRERERMKERERKKRETERQRERKRDRERADLALRSRLSGVVSPFLLRSSVFSFASYASIGFLALLDFLHSLRLFHCLCLSFSPSLSLRLYLSFRPCLSVPVSPSLSLLLSVPAPFVSPLRAMALHARHAVSYPTRRVRESRRTVPAV